MKRVLAAFTSVLVLAACTDTPAPLEPAAPSYATGVGWWLTPPGFPGPDVSQNFTGGGWEVATQFYSTVQVCIQAVRFWRAVGETGTNTIKLWTNSGTKLLAVNVGSTGTGWQQASVPNGPCLQPNTYYRVSVNTNTAQVKRGGVFLNGPIVNGPMVSTAGYYGQPTGSMPTSHSYSYFYVEVYGVES